MAIVAPCSSIRFVIATLRRYCFSLGHGVLTVVVGAAVFWSADWRYEPVLWGLLSAQACLLGFWMAMADRSWQTRAAYGGLHLLGLLYCVLAAGQFHLELRTAAYFLLDVLRDVPAMLASSFAAGWLLRRRGWRLSAGADDDGLTTALPARNYQVPLGDFIKWFTLLCITQGLSVSLLPAPSSLFDEWMWRSRFSLYLEFVLTVCLPTEPVALFPNG